MKYYVYIVSCNDGTYYTGSTWNLRFRINCHNGVGFWPGAKYTKSRRPVFLEYIQRFPRRKDAVAREKEIKKLSHDSKHKLIESTTKEEIIASI